MDSLNQLNAACPGAIDSTPGSAGALFANLVSTLFAAQCSLTQNQYYPANYADKLTDGSQFDFIVVGAGSAGAVVANRLTENPNWKVLIVEAGGIPTVTTMIPGLHHHTQMTDYDWHYFNEPSTTSCLGMKNTQCICPRGKTLGGSSSINGMVYMRGAPQVYDRWAAAGNVGWDYKSVLPYFLKSERTQEEKYLNDPNHGTTGYLGTSIHATSQNIANIILDAAAELGIPIGDDEIHNGYFQGLSTIENTERCSSATGYLRRIVDRPNLFIATDVLVSRVLVNQANMSAYGIEAKVGGKMMNLLASKEVVLSAGAIASPQILMNSGIGPKAHLDDLGITVVKDLHVGKNLQDHVSFPWVTAKLGEGAMQDVDMQDELYKYYAHKTGEMTSTTVLSINGFININNMSNPEPNLQMIHVASFKGSGIANAWNFNDETFESLVYENNNYNILNMLPALLTPKSRGEVLLRSTDPFDPPRIHSGFFSDENDEDFETMYKGIQFAKEVYQTAAFQNIGAEILWKNVTDCNPLPFDSEAWWKCLLRHMASTTYHQSGTCKMGPISDETAVVDDRLSVHGIATLRVVDSSIMPLVVSGNTNAPTIMIGEKGADMIRQDWGC